VNPGREADRRRAARRKLIPEGAWPVFVAGGVLAVALICGIVYIATS
jgi:hypothetical protein